MICIFFGENDFFASVTHVLISFTKCRAFNYFCFNITQEDVKFSIDMMNAKLTDEDKIQCNKVIKSYLDGKVADPVSEGKTI